MVKENKTPPGSPSNIEDHFPCEYPIKVFGPTGDQFEISVLTIIRKHVPDLRENAIRNRTSKKGNYTALTIVLYIESKEQIDAIYQDLTKSPDVLMVL